jgi:hypothetical protein
LENRSADIERTEKKEAKMKRGKSEKPSEEYQRFEKLAKALISVPKSEIDKRQAEYERQRKADKKRKVVRPIRASATSTRFKQRPSPSRYRPLLIK